MENRSLPGSIDNFEAVSPPVEHGDLESRRERNPRITPAGFQNFLRLKNHPAAPRWNYEVGDRLTDAAFAEAECWRQALPGLQNLDPAEQRRRITRDLLERTPVSVDLARRIGGYSRVETLLEHWAAVDTSSREDLSERLADSVPGDVEYSSLIVFETSGTTGHSLRVPLSPLVQSRNMILMEEALARHGVRLDFTPAVTACLNITARALAVVFPNVQSLWNEAGFARVNLHPDFWQRPEDMAEFIHGTAPQLLTGDPLAFRELQRLGIAPRAQALLSTGLDLPPDWSTEFRERWKLPVIDWYSLTETGPIGCSCPANRGFHLLAPDLFVEILDPEGRPCPPGSRGEITVSGGRNPYLPLLRYRTGDHAVLDPAPCDCGWGTPRIVGLTGRPPLRFRRADGTVINPVDVSRLLQGMSVARFHGLQKRQGDFELQVIPYPGGSPDNERIRRRLESLFGPDIPLRIETLPVEDPSMPGRATYAVE